MQKLHKKQQGLTLISLIFVLGLIGFFTLLALKVGPTYMNALEAR
jgi:type II secretory pathway pseudopilin PulG